MTFAAINWLNISIHLAMVIFFIVCLLMVLLILMQRPKQEGLGATFGTNVTDQVFGARTTNVLQKGTVYLGSAFFILSLFLAWAIGKRNKTNSLFIDQPAPAAVVAPAQPAKSLTEQAKEVGQPVPAAELTPATPVTPAAETAPATPAVETTPAVATPAPAAEPAPAVPAGETKPAGQ